ncbi:GDYXXLXY domain-containing protein [Tenuibacillus multivorans]|uniref:Uncharacterized membrane-anchored protein n=1 Tax=Tenuibacillus multivorans TaxID=237069 RepID=A0A1H0A0H4_9BACI|nr:GDYXXLXY domain-containing protein [Tenuibacillus multivorans]GEL78344.1 hypothetical protein TMU01_25790 [Tenuibacillus multivorans]SDN26877.1 Uncharacterized membrane-anchored protein [Tenuibacillus multivorans]
MRKKLFVIVVTLQVVFLVGMAGLNYFFEEFSQIIQLETEPYDPRDVFYGDYVHLNYTAESIRPENWFASEDVKPNQVIYVLLKPDERGIYRVKAASDKKMDPNEDEAVIRARYLNQEFEDAYRVNYGLSRYYIEEGTGEKFDTTNDKMIVTIALSPWGQKKILEVEEMK